MAIAVNNMGCGLDTRPAALACLRIIIAALNILIAVSFHFIDRVPMIMNFILTPEYCRALNLCWLIVIRRIVSPTFFSWQLLNFLSDWFRLIVCCWHFFLRLNLDFLPPPAAAAAASWWDSGELDVAVNRISEEP